MGSVIDESIFSSRFWLSQTFRISWLGINADGHGRKIAQTLLLTGIQSKIKTT